VSKLTIDVIDVKDEQTAGEALEFVSYGYTSTLKTCTLDLAYCGRNMPRMDGMKFVDGLIEVSSLVPFSIVNVEVKVGISDTLHQASQLQRMLFPNACQSARSVRQRCGSAKLASNLPQIGAGKSAWKQLVIELRYELRDLLYL